MRMIEDQIESRRSSSSRFPNGRRSEGRERLGQLCRAAALGSARVVGADQSLAEMHVVVTARAVGGHEQIDDERN
jgi:hypothetical protein